MAAGWRAVGGRLPAPTTVSTMHSHHIALALAEARLADRQRVGASHSVAIVPPRRHRQHLRALALLAVAATAVLAALAPTGALARPTEYSATPANTHVDGAPAPKPERDLRALAKTSSLSGTASPPRQDRRSRDARHAALAAQTPQDLRSADARDAGEGRGTFNSPRVVVVKTQPQTRPALTNGIDWADAGIGAGSLLAISLLALGTTLLILHRRHAAHHTVAPGAR
jgi:hypothetical protein